MPKHCRTLTSKELVVHGLLQARIEPDSKWQYGDRVTVQGKIITPPESGDFSYRDYLANHNIYSMIRPDQITLVERGQGSILLNVLYSLRQRAYIVINRLLPQPEAGLLSGILLGIENDLPEQLKLAFQDTGTYHIIAISGFNIAIVAALFMSFSKRTFPLPVVHLGCYCWNCVIYSACRGPTIGCKGGGNGGSWFNRKTYWP